MRLPEIFELARQDVRSVGAARLADLRARARVHGDGDGRIARGAQRAKIRGVRPALREPERHPPLVASLRSQRGAPTVVRVFQGADHLGARRVIAEDEHEKGRALGLCGRNSADHVALVKESHRRAFGVWRVLV